MDNDIRDEGRLKDFLRHAGLTWETAFDPEDGGDIIKLVGWIDFIFDKEGQFLGMKSYGTERIPVH